MCYILQANLNGRFLPNPLPMTSALLARLQLLLTQPVTQPEREPNVGTEREIGAARGGVAGCHVFSRSKKKKTRQLRISAAMETYLVTAPAPLHKLPQL